MLQFCWWTFLLVKQENEIHRLEQKILSQNVQRGLNEEVSTVPGDELNSKLHKQWIMIFGEGSVFLILLILGIYRTRNSFRKEVALNERQKNFILSVTHELRSPLASIRLQLETLRKRELPKEKQTEMQDNAIEDIDRLNVLIENILVAARIDDHTYSLRMQQENISDLLEDLCTKSKNNFAREHRLECSIEKNIICATDKMSFHSIIINLLENAVKYSQADSLISVSMKKKNKAVAITITDRGAGIPENEKENIFGRFYRIGNEETRRTKGTGLGLYIVRNLVHAHGWNISVRDNTGKGTIFEIGIPLT